MAARHRKEKKRSPPKGLMKAPRGSDQATTLRRCYQADARDPQDRKLASTMVDDLEVIQEGAGPVTAGFGTLFTL
jgi:hypothetical protein